MHQLIEHVVEGPFDGVLQVVQQRVHQVQEGTDGGEARHVGALELTDGELYLVVLQQLHRLQAQLLLQTPSQLILNMS